MDNSTQSTQNQGSSGQFFSKVLTYKIPHLHSTDGITTKKL